ncbi:hypothetical protein Scep_014237 [Stephania cephalantha]|uniref:Uncharacterized protein n=1 Tax=Stephania cephalantha TaxID=152367 RepID=A0AAP0J0U5_9MAGN
MTTKCNHGGGEASGGRVSETSHYREAFLCQSRCSDVPASDDGGGRRSLVAPDTEANPAVKTSPCEICEGDGVTVNREGDGVLT